MAWNDLHEELGWLYCSLMGGGVVNQLIATWAAVTNDRLKRDMLISALEKEHHGFRETFPRLQEDVLWLVHRTQSLEDDRNNIVHSPLTLGGTYSEKGLTKLIPRLAGGNVRARKLQAKAQELLPEFKRVRDSTIMLRNFCQFVLWGLGDARSPWPDRPELPGRGTNAAPRTQPHQGAKR